MIVLPLGRFGSAHSRVLTHVRRRGSSTREELARLTGLSTSTVARTLSALVDAGMLVERPDLHVDRAPGRPSVPVQVDTRHHVTLGVHVGRRVTTLGVGDLRGQVLRRTTLLTPADAHELAVAANRGLTGLLAQERGRAVVAAGLVGPWGDLAHGEEHLAGLLRHTLGLEVTSWEMIPALAAAEYLSRDDELPGSTLYVYSRDTVGFVMANQVPAGMEISRVGRLGHFPVGGRLRCRCGRHGCLESVVSDEALLRSARAEGLATEDGVRGLVRDASLGDDAAHRLLSARGEALGRAVATVADMVHPDRVVLCGQGFTDYPLALDRVRHSFREHTATSAGLPLLTTRVVGDVQAVAACDVALRTVYDDPLAVTQDLDLHLTV